MERGASFSPDRQYRWTLYRQWAKGARVLFICLNSSTADEIKDDPTVRRCVGFAWDWGYSAVMIGNLFGLRSMDPRDLTRVDNPVGDKNDFALRMMFDLASLVVYAWGNHGQINGRGREVRKMLGPAWCFGLNKSGEPVHPLYQRRDAELVRY